MITLDRASGALRIGQAGAASSGGAAGVIKLSPKAREGHSVHDAIPSIPTNAIAPFLSQPLVIEEGTLKGVADTDRCARRPRDTRRSRYRLCERPVPE